VIHLRVGEGLVNRENRTAGDAGRVEDLDPLGAVACSERVLDEVAQLLAILVACRRFAEPIVVGEPLHPDGPREVSELTVARGGDVDGAVLYWEHPGRESRGVVVTGLRWDLATDEPPRGLEVEHRDGGLEQGGLDPLAFA
jgi:hypothetical protein